MKTYIRFENGKQLEVATLVSKPSEEGWKIAPANFEFSKRYKLASGKIEEVSVDELAAMRLAETKAMIATEISMLVDNARSKYVGGSPAKQKCYELQEKAALSVLENAESPLGSILQPLADVRNITILEMAELILAKAQVANQKIIWAEAIEDNYKLLIENAETIEQIDQLLVEISTTLKAEEN
ncbi:hypothetical protein FACS1894122_05490 [Alphaproteobacteria bacterium]|nr:hypothetical protein FACS1894122_05490 [Alphaproteobacteria bacterium]